MVGEVTLPRVVYLDASGCGVSECGETSRHHDGGAFEAVEDGQLTLTRVRHRRGFTLYVGVLWCTGYLLVASMPHLAFDLVTMRVALAPVRVEDGCPKRENACQSGLCADDGCCFHDLEK